LYEVLDPDVEGCKLTLRADVKSYQSRAYYPSITCRLSDGTEKSSLLITEAAKGDTNWAPYEASLEVPPGARAQQVRVDFREVPFQNTDSNATARLGVKDVILVKAPLPPSGSSSHP
jgi:hypothetical protein